MENIDKHWFALYTKPRQEFKAASEFYAKNLDFYLPTVIRLKQWSDRKKKVEVPLMNGYIFLHGNEKERLIALQQNPIVRTICFGGKPARVPDWEIENLQKILEKSSNVKIQNELVAGTKVKVIDGPFQGIEGYVHNTPNNERHLAIVLNMLKRSVVISLDPRYVVKKID